LESRYKREPSGIVEAFIELEKEMKRSRKKLKE